VAFQSPTNLAFFFKFRPERAPPHLVFRRALLCPEFAFNPLQLFVIIVMGLMEHAQPLPHHFETSRRKRG